MISVQVNTYCANFCAAFTQKSVIRCCIYAYCVIHSVYSIKYARKDRRSNKQASLFVLLNLCCRLHLFDGMNNLLTSILLPYFRVVVKGQLILKCPFDVIVSTKIPTIFLRISALQEVEKKKIKAHYFFFNYLCKNNLIRDFDLTSF